MDEEYGFPIRGEELRNWLRTSGSSVFRAFETGGEVLRYLRDQGIQIRDSDFYAIRRQVLSSDAFIDRTSYDPGNELIPKRDIDFEHGMRLNSNFLYKVEITGVNPFTGDPTTRWVNVTSVFQLTPNEVSDQAGALVIGYEQFYGIVFDSARVDRAYGKPELNQ